MCIRDSYTTVMPAGISIISGSGNIVTVKYGKAADKNDKNIYYLSLIHICSIKALSNSKASASCCTNAFSSVA